MARRVRYLLDGPSPPARQRRRRITRADEIVQRFLSDPEVSSRFADVRRFSLLDFRKLCRQYDGVPDPQSWDDVDLYLPELIAAVGGESLNLTGKPGKKPRGRHKASEAERKADGKLDRAWKNSGYRTIRQYCDERNVDEETLRAAIDRVRKRP